MIIIFKSAEANLSYFLKSYSIKTYLNATGIKGRPFSLEKLKKLLEIVGNSKTHHGKFKMVGCWSSVYIGRIIYIFLNVCPFDYTAVAVSGKVTGLTWVDCFYSN